MIYSTFFQKILHSPYFIGISRTCCTTYFHTNHPFHPQKHHLNPIFSVPYRQVLSQKRAKSMLFLPITASFIKNLHLSGTCPGTCPGVANLVVLSTLLLDKYAIMEQTENTYYNFLFLTSSSKSINSSSSSLSALFIA